MSIQINKILYICAEGDIKPVIHFPETKEFVFTDILPRSSLNWEDNHFRECNYSSNFVDNLIVSCKKYGFNLKSKIILDENYCKKIIPKSWYYLSWIYKIPNHIDPTMLVFCNKQTQQKITYYISTNIKFNMNTLLKEDIASCDGLIVRTNSPETDILQYFTTPKVFFGYTDTCYSMYTEPNLGELFKQYLIHFLHNCVCNTQYYFSKFYMVHHDTGKLTYCPNFAEFNETVHKYQSSLNRYIIYK